MTARRWVRVRSGRIGLLVAVVSLAVVATLGVVGVRTLFNSSAGQTATATASTPIQQLPYTPTGLIGVTDDDGVLTSAAAIVIAPDGTGGTIVPLAVSADSGAGTTDVLRPINAEHASGGAERFAEAAERLTGLSFDVVELVDTARLADLLAPLGDVTVTLPSTVFDASSEEEWESGTRVLGPSVAARLLAARAPSVPDWYFEPDREAVWAAVAERVGAGIGSAESVEVGDRVPVPGSMDELVDRLYADRVEFRALAFTPVDDERRDEQLPDELAAAMAEFTDPEAIAVVANARSEVLLVFASIAPGRLGAPLDAAAVRIEIGLPDDALAGSGMSRADVAERAVSVALFSGLNVVSVVDDPALGAEDATYVDVAGDDGLEDAWEVFPELFGDVEVQLADVRIDGVDAVVQLGRSWLADIVDDDGVDDGDGPASDPEADDDADEPADDDGADAADDDVEPSPEPDDEASGDDAPPTTDAASIEAELNTLVAESPIRFEPGSNVLAADSGPVLDELATALGDVTGVSVVIEGHTDSLGADSVNLQISQQRAEAVLDALVERGVDESLLSAEGLGSADLVLVDGVEDQEASRRVEFRVEAPGSATPPDEPEADEPEAEVAPEDAAASVEAELNAIVAESPIQFQPGSNLLAPAAELVVDELAAVLNDALGVTVVIEGHTDSLGADSLNLQISQQRAEAVLDALVERGVDEALLSAEGLGSADLVLVDGVEDQEASRRVEFRVELVP